MRRSFLALAAFGAAAAVLSHLGPRPASAATLPEGFAFRGLAGETLALDNWRGRPVLVVNTASRCGFTGQLDDLQALYDRFRDRGLVVLAVPSGDFNQELATDEAVAEFCEVNFALDFPMAGITPIRGPQAHPLYAWLAREHGFVPRWNFNKVLLGRNGEVRGTWGAQTRPLSRPIQRAVEEALRG